MERRANDKHRTQDGPLRDGRVMVGSMVLVTSAPLKNDVCGGAKVLYFFLIFLSHLLRPNFVFVVREV